MKSPARKIGVIDGGLSSRAKLGAKLEAMEDGYSSSQEGSKKNLLEMSPNKRSQLPLVRSAKEKKGASPS